MIVLFLIPAAGRLKIAKGVTFKDSKGLLLKKMGGGKRKKKEERRNKRKKNERTCDHSTHKTRSLSFNHILGCFWGHVPGAGGQKKKKK